MSDCIGMGIAMLIFMGFRLMTRIFLLLVSSFRKKKKKAIEVILYGCTFKSSLFLTSVLQVGVLLVI